MNDNPQMIVCRNEAQAKEESEKRIADFCSIEIDPDAISNIRGHYTTSRRPTP